MHHAALVVGRHFPSKTIGFLYGGTATAPRRHCDRTRARKDNSAPAEDLHNKNPSLALSGKRFLCNSNVRCLTY